MRILLDTNVVSELRKPDADPAVKARVAAFKPEDLCIASVTLGELTHGIQRLPRGRRKDGLTAWLERLEALHGDRILPFDREAATVWGRMLARSEQKGRTLPLEDAQIAATAVRFGLRVMTRNVGDFEPTGVEVVNPWDPSG